jgi:hypothetical protein
VDEVVHTMIHELNRKGKAAGAGFYEYPENGKKHLWDGLSRWTKENDVSEQEMIDRFLFVQALDTLRCYEEGVLESVVDANVGSILALVLPRGQVARFNSSIKTELKSHYNVPNNSLQNMENASLLRNY